MRRRTISEAGDQLRGRAPHYMATFDLIPATVDDVLGADKAEQLRQGLRRALYVRGLPEASNGELEQLDEAAGTFTALGDYLRASP